MGRFDYEKKGIRWGGPGGAKGQRMSPKKARANISEGNTSAKNWGCAVIAFLTFGLFTFGGFELIDWIIG